jgi:hypothetical protein
MPVIMFDNDGNFVVMTVQEVSRVPLNIPSPKSLSFHFVSLTLPLPTGENSCYPCRLVQTLCLALGIFARGRWAPE